MGAEPALEVLRRYAGAVEGRVRDLLVKEQAKARRTRTKFRSRAQKLLKRRQKEEMSVATRHCQTTSAAPSSTATPA